MDTWVQIVAGVAVFVVLSFIFERRLNAEKQARGRYKDALRDFKRDPDNKRLREKVVELGRVYAAKCRHRDNESAFDETALQNDIKEACRSR